ncbi:hypothetical protein Droror1_Dr00020983 [Drosera rotundifolia]
MSSNEFRFFLSCDINLPVTFRIDRLEGSLPPSKAAESAANGSGRLPPTAANGSGRRSLPPAVATCGGQRRRLLSAANGGGDLVRRSLPPVCF